MLGDASPPPDAAQLRSQVARSVRELRARSGRSLADLASAAGIGKSTLHAIEAGDANPGIETLWGLASALGVPFGHLLEPPTPVMRVLRAGEGPRVSSEAATMQAHLLASTGHAARVELYALHLQLGPLRDALPHTDGTVEHVLVTAGRLRVGPVGSVVELDVGDLATFPGDVGHRYEALTEEARGVLLIEYP